MTASRAGSERLKVGIIGGGAITQVAHLPVLKKLKTIEVQAICDTDLPKARALADRFAVKDAFDDIEDLLRFESLDAVVICSPNHLHESHILAALSANLHVLVEKPLAMSAASAPADHPRGGEARPGRDGRDEPPLPARRPDRPQLRAERRARARSRASAGAGTCSAPAARSSAGGSGGTRPAVARCSISASRSSTWACGWAAIPTPDPSERQPRFAGKDRSVEQSGSAFVVCENGMSLFVDVTWHHLGEGERFGVGVRGSKGTAAINPLTVWKELHGVPMDVSPTGSGSRENAVHRLLPGRVGPLRGRARRRGEGARRSQDHVVLHKVIDAIYSRRQDGETWTL